MITLNYKTPVDKLEKIKIGDEIVDEYQSQGRVTKILKKMTGNAVEFTFHLDNRQTVYILSEAPTVQP